MKSLAKNNIALKAGLGFTLANIVGKGINFLTLPLFSRLMTTEEFGVYSVFLSYDAILFVIIGLALHSSVRSADYEYKGKIDEYVSSISLVYILMLFVFVITIALCGNIISTVVAFPKAILYLLVLYSFGSAVISLYNSSICIKYDYKRYLIFSVVNSLLNVSISLVLILTFFIANKDFGRILGATLTVFVLSLFLLISFYRKARPKYNREYWRFGIKYSLPIIPHGISQVLLAQFDRIMIRNIVSDSAAGIYSLAANIKLVLTIITDSISSAWTNWYYSEISNGNIASIKKKSVQMMLGCTIVLVCVMAISPELVLILGGKEYDSGKYVVIPMILDAYIIFAYNVIIPGEYYKKKTTLIMIGTIASAIIDVVLNAIFIPKYGFIAAAYTTLFSYICYLILHIFFTKKITGFHAIPINKLLFFSSIIVIAALINLAIIDHMFLRWIVALAEAIPITIYFVKKYYLENNGNDYKEEITT